MLKSVLLPDPFGPMTPRTSPCRTARSTFETAVKPPNRLVRFLISRSIAVSLLGWHPLGYADCLEASPYQEIFDNAAKTARHEKNHQYNHGSKYHHPVLVVVASEIIDDCHRDGADDTAPNMADATNNDHQQHRHHFGDGIAIGMEKAGRHVRL